MPLRTISLVLAGTIIALLTCSDANAWGGCHVGYTHVGPGGVYHCGATAFHGPYGACGGYHYGGFGGVHYGGVAYGAPYGAVTYTTPYSSPNYGGVTYGVPYGGVTYGGAAYGGAYHYYGGYHACAYGGFHAGAAYGGAYHAGVYRHW